MMKKGVTMSKKRVAWADSVKKEKKSAVIMKQEVKQEVKEEEEGGEASYNEQEEQRPQKRSRKDPLIRGIGERLDSFLDNSFLMHLSDAITEVDFSPIRGALIDRITELSDVYHGAALAQQTIHDYLDDVAKRATEGISGLYHMGHKVLEQKRKRLGPRNPEEEEEERRRREEEGEEEEVVPMQGVHITFHHRRLHKALFLPENSKKRTVTELKLIKQVWANEGEHEAIQPLLDDARFTHIDIISITLDKKFILASILPCEVRNYALTPYKNSAANDAYQKLLAVCKSHIKLLYDAKKLHPDLTFPVAEKQAM
jgi:hypothetical protein